MSFGTIVRVQNFDVMKEDTESLMSTDVTKEARITP